MRGFIFVMAFLGLLGVGAWAYSENYDMRAQQRLAASLQAEIGGLRDAIATQRAEWAYLSRPDRLRELVNLNFDRLELMPMEPAQLGSARTISYPPPAAESGLPLDLDLSQSVSVSAVPNADPEDTAP